MDEHENVADLHFAAVSSEGEAHSFDTAGDLHRGFCHWKRKLMWAAHERGFQRKHRQGLNTLRKFHATEMCREFGEQAAASSIGHVNGTKVARKHYIQPDAIQKPKLAKSISEALSKRGVA